MNIMGWAAILLEPVVLLDNSLIIRIRAGVISSFVAGKIKASSK